MQILIHIYSAVTTTIPPPPPIQSLYVSVPLLVLFLIRAIRRVPKKNSCGFVAMHRMALLPDLDMACFAQLRLHVEQPQWTTHELQVLKRVLYSCMYLFKSHRLLLLPLLSTCFCLPENGTFLSQVPENARHFVIGRGRLWKFKDTSMLQK